MGCLLALFGGAFPRLLTLFIWLARPAMFTAAFGGSWLIPLLGIVFLPVTTLMYVIVWSSTGLTGFDWVWLGLAFVLDLGHLSATSYQGRNRMPGYSGGRQY